MGKSNKVFKSKSKTAAAADENSDDRDIRGSQKKFINDVKDNADKLFMANKVVPIEHRPTLKVYLGQRVEERLPDVELYYDKEVMLCAPHMNFPGVKIKCPCGGLFCPKQWADPRTIYGLDGQIYLLQYRY